MKKHTKLLTIGAILLAGIFCTSCGAGALVQNTYDQWYKYSGNIGDVALETSAATNAAPTDVIKNAELYLKYNAQNGLTVAIQTTNKKDMDLLGGLTSYSVEVVAGQEKQYDKTSFGPIKWEALYLTGTLVPCEEPKIVSNPEQCIILNSVFDNGIQWETFLKQKLVEMILGEDIY